MKLVRIEIENFRQYKEVSVEFSSGLLGITGDNGAGKTTLIEAIIFALYGTKAVRGKLEDLKTKGVLKEKVSVELTFSLKDEIYRILRTATDAKLFVGGEAESGITGSREVTQQIVKLLGMNLEEFSATFLTEQKGLEFLSGKKGATEREKFITRMMGFDRLETLQELLRDQRREKKQLAVGYESGLGNRADLETQAVMETDKVKILQDLTTDKARVLDSNTKAYDQEKKGFTAVEEAYKNFRVVSHELSVLETRHEETVKRIKNYEIRIKDLHETTLFGKPLREITAEKSITDIALALRDRLQTLSGKKQEIEAELRNRIDRKKQAIDGLQLEQAGINKQLLILKKRGGDYTSLTTKAQCPTCGQTLGEGVHNLLEEIGREKDLHLQRLALLSDQIKEAQKPSENEEEASRLLKTVEKQFLEAAGELNSVEKVVGVDLERTTLETQLLSLREEIQELDTKAKEVRKKLSSLKISEESFLGAKAKLSAAESMLNVSRLQKVQADGELSGAQKLLERTVDQLRTFDEKQESLKQLRKSLLVYEESDLVLTEFRKALSESIRPKLAELASDFLSELTDGRYNEVCINPDFSPTVYDANEVKPVISGGETDILHLCVRLALSQLLAERAGQAFNLLILDEVFGSLDQQRRLNVLELLEKLSNRFEQIIIITHMDDIREGVDAVLHVSYDPDEGTARISEGDLNEYYLAPE